MGSLLSGNLYCRVRYYRGFVTMGGRYYRGIFTIGVRYYPWIITIGGSLLSGAPYYREVFAIRGCFYPGVVTFAEHKTSSRVDAAKLSYKIKDGRF